jgi:CRP-like cAMP-binding protein
VTPRESDPIGGLSKFVYEFCFTKVMPDRDFFAFCTSLSRPELRTIGELSWVRHLNEGEVLYRPGEPGNALFIVNRGEIEVTAERMEERVRLARGQVIGHVEAFSEMPRTQLVRAPTGASLQCFPRANFHQLVRLVPSFFRYLCEQMAFRVLQANDQVQQMDSAPLSGRISHFDLTTVHQTIANSGQTGELRIKDELADTIGAFYFEAGRPAAGQFEHLTGEEAFWQLFLHETLAGTFSFSVGERPMTNWIASGQIVRSTGDMLIAALQFRDELDALKKQIQAETSARLIPKKQEFHWNGGAPEELRPVATRVWELVQRKPLTIGELYRQCSVCELKIYQVVHHLFDQEQIAFN